MNLILGIGSNLGERKQNIIAACDLLERKLGKILAKSSIIETKPWGFESNDLFLNAVIVIETDKTPLEALEICFQIERNLGRVRSNATTYQSRTIDLDILFCDDVIMSSNRLTIPHPLIIYRDFVLTPLKEIVPNFVHPVLKRKISDLELVSNEIPSDKP
ncbi:MAG: 2-amino-4-hydroxy-6-hydroxymethyldihydropteridine diphosphokinase [Bacteroidales bacterium]|jgi:2-amino-4-hydroxy-6-hydroxymethyldihydropteridine diphosphokinase|nr:2-amino-4-hydroxy-6-hydroxymethyldihydropteridine diphosphokinase [Bacteroidales bacterium]